MHAGLERLDHKMYIKPHQTQVLNEVLPGCAEQIFESFYADDSTVGYPSHLGTVHRCEAIAGKWSREGVRDDAPQRAWRDVRFTCSVPVAPGSSLEPTRCEMRQEYLKFEDGRVLVVDSEMRMPDSTFGKYYSVEERMIFVDDCRRDGDVQCVARKYVGIQFTKDTVFRSSLTATSILNSKDGGARWAQHMRRCLSLDGESAVAETGRLDKGAVGTRPSVPASFMMMFCFTLVWAICATVIAVFLLSEQISV